MGLRVDLIEKASWFVELVSLYMKSEVNYEAFYDKNVVAHPLTLVSIWDFF